MNFHTQYESLADMVLSMIMKHKSELTAVYLSAAKAPTAANAFTGRCASKGPPDPSSILVGVYRKGDVRYTSLRADMRQTVRERSPQQVAA